MKIFYLITKSEIGGAQTHVAQLTKYFVEQGHEVVVMSAGDGWLKQTVQSVGGVFVVNDFLDNSFNPFKLLPAGKKIRSAVATFKPDIFCCHSSAAGFVGRLTVRNKIPTVFTAHGWDFAAYRPWWRRQLVILAEKIAAWYCVKIICVSNFVKDLAQKNLVAPAEKFSVIYNGVEIQPSGRSKTEVKPLKIIFVGRLAEPKNPAMLIDAYARLSTKLKADSKLVIVGDGPQKKVLENLIARLGLENKVEFVGSLPRAQMFDLLAESAVMVLPSFWESFGLSVLEAMSVSVPVIASKVGGLKELVTNDSGILVDTVDELTKALEKILFDETVRNEYGAKGQIRARDFSIESMCQKNASLYEEIIHTQSN